MPALEHKIPPPAVAALVAVGMWSVAGFGPQLTITPAVTNAAVAVLVVTGLAFAALGILAFRASRTTVDPLHPERASALVTGGIYRITRNPMYVGMAFVLLAWAVYLHAVLPFVGIGVFVFYITRFQIQPEEGVLSRRFPGMYAAFCERTWRWI